MRVTDLAGRFDMSLNAISKHIRVLERAGLVSRETRWREHLIAAEMEPTRLIDAWFGQLRSAWELRLTRLQEVLESHTAMTTDLSLRVTQHIAAAPERVFDAWLDPATLVHFITPDPGFREPEVTNDPREGGGFKVIMKAPERDLPHWGTYKEIDRPNRLVFTWVSEFSLEDSTVTLTFAPKDGGTDVTLTHERFKSEELRDNHEKGWGAILNRLAQHLG